jgi:3D (Asp-Asp-Asp) domain-containing protein
MNRRIRPASLLLVITLLSLFGCRPERSMVVTVTAYNSVPSQTDAQPNIGAWGDRLEPGMKAVAVSPDLVAAGLGRGTRLRIEGFPDRYVVLDKTARRFKKRIDIFMGKDVRRAKEFGVKKLRIYWRVTPAE